MSTGPSKTVREKQFASDLGQKALIEHHQIENDEQSEALREVLRDIGKDLQTTRKVPPELEYVASFSVHVYKGGLSNFAFAGVNANMEKCPHALADAAAKKLAQDIREYHNGRRQKLRSGF